MELVDKLGSCWIRATDNVIYNLVIDQNQAWAYSQYIITVDIFPSELLLVSSLLGNPLLIATNERRAVSPSDRHADRIWTRRKDLVAVI